jgi:hypothetical protein
MFLAFGRCLIYWELLSVEEIQVNLWVMSLISFYIQGMVYHPTSLARLYIFSIGCYFILYVTVH